MIPDRAQKSLWFPLACAAMLTLAAISPVAHAQATIPEWEWVGGSDVLGQAYGNYGQIGIPYSTNIPPPREGASSWTDASGDFWLFGGFGGSEAYGEGYLSDVWEFSPSTYEWTWEAGSSTISQMND